LSETPKDKERRLITSRDPKRPYGAKVTFQLLYSASIGDLDNVTLFLESGSVATIAPARSFSWEGGKRLQVTLEGFPTATKAENEGIRLAQALLLCAISLDFGLRLVYHSQEPAVVFERFRPEGSSGFGEGMSGRSQQVALAELIGACNAPLLDRSLILSMELYCAARLEASERARFITVVSALEPLAKQESLGPAVSSFVDSSLAILEEATGIENALVASLRGRLAELRKESVGQALRRLCLSWFPQRDDILKRIRHAYSIRSELVHEGKLLDPDVDLAIETTEISKILRSIYEQASGRSFRIPPGV
jgi:hypothetical protein